jgi:hypothetical protein
MNVFVCVGDSSFAGQVQAKAGPARFGVGGRSILTSA